MSASFPGIRKNFGFGCMRLPMAGDKVDTEQFRRMVDMFLDRGFNYFDTAHPYLGGQSETALRECLTSRYPRDSFILTNKLSVNFFEKEEDILPLFQTQLAACGVDYFDFYLMHAMSGKRYQKFTDCRAFAIARELKAQGKIRHIGMSFHDKPEVLDRILTQQPCIEVVQLQFNYLDAYDPVVQGMDCLQVCRKHNKPVIVMEPVKGGSLMNLPEEAKAILDSLGGGSYASYAIRYAASADGVMMVLSGMSSTEQMADNLSFMADFRPLDQAEYAALDRVRGVFGRMDLIPCTACRYCTDGCPMHINIPSLFSSLNARTMFGGDSGSSSFAMGIKGGGKPSDCVSCGQCEAACPQQLAIRRLLKKVSAQFE